MTHFRPLVLWTVLLCVAVSSAQASDRPRGPQPIRASELARYGDLLHLSDEQRFAVEGLYETYLDEYEPLRWEIMELAVRYPRRHGGSTAHEEPFLSRLPSFVSRTRALDEQLLAQIEPLLADAQRERLPRVRRMRERTIYANIDTVARFIGDGVPDLAILVHDLRLPKELREPMEPALLAYEERLTRGMREIFETVMRLCVRGEAQAAHDLGERIQSLRAMNRQTYRDLHLQLPEDTGRMLRYEFYRRAYGGILFSARFDILEIYDAALQLPNLTDRERETILRKKREAVAYQDKVLEDLAETYDGPVIEAIDRRPRPAGAPVDPLGGIQRSRTDAGNEVIMDLNRLTAEQLRELRALLGPAREHATRISFGPSPYDEGTHGTDLVCGVRVQRSVMTHGRPAPNPAFRNDQLIPLPIIREDLELFAILLELDADGRQVLIELHREYNEETRPALEDVQRRERGIRMPQNVFALSADEREAAAAQLRESRQALRAEARRMIDEADAKFFAALSAAFAIDENDAVFDRIRRLRQRMILLVGSHGDGLPNRAAEVDLVSLLVGLRLEPEHWGGAEPAIQEYEARLHALLTIQHRALHQYFEPLSARMDTREAAAEQEPRREALHAAHAAVAAFNQSSVEQLAAALPDDAAALLREAFDRRAYPMAYDDPASMEPVIAQAAALPDLNERQRDQIVEVRAEYAAEYVRVREWIIEECAAYVPFIRAALISGVRQPERDEAFAQAMAALNEERAAANRRAMRGLRSALTPAQLRRLTPPDVD